MGFFSWKTSDTDESISNVHSTRGAKPVYLLCPDGSFIFEPEYEGYGVFGGKDAYALLAQWNKPEECNGNTDHDRSIGIDISFGKETIKYPLKFVESPMSYDEVEASNDCPEQGYFYEDFEF